MTPGATRRPGGWSSWPRSTSPWPSWHPGCTRRYHAGEACGILHRPRHVGRCALLCLCRVRRSVLGAMTGAVTHSRTPTTLLAAVAGVTALWLAALYAIVLVAQPDAILGIVQKVFYVHVAAAFAMLICLSAGSVASLVDLLQPNDRIDAAARALVDTGVLFALAVLTTGPLWARKSWGMWWTWEPRLTLTLLVLLIAVGVLAVRTLAPPGPAGRRVGAALATLAAPTAYLIHVAVQRWGGTHPQVIQGGGIQSPGMRLAFWVTVAAMLGLAAVVTTLRYRVARLEDAVVALRLDLSARDLRRARTAAREPVS
ncbi:MAG: hypothetical protein EXR79_14150 [Myxococcales bacterium]|nr:hypothetical protein [Myxococcales bacterium]